ncbi:MAG: UvrD-helicase domain-containing protein [Gammaproteobacteria bacterium]|nr:UvrD-helicase domain-containing protein [Gammaproteobacteria bacterium]
MPDDRAARAEALDPRRSFIVQAPAGSGKTELLIQRYLALLATVDAPEEVVALTFTRKAAEEMRTRVLAALSAVGGPPPAETHGQVTRSLAQAVAARATERSWEITSCPARLRIGTFDALCAMLVTQSPVAAGAGAALDVTEDAGALYEEAALALFARLDDKDAVGEALAELLPALANDVDKFVTLVAGLLARREQWLPLLLGSVEDGGGLPRAVLESALAAFREALARRLDDLCPRPVRPLLCRLGEAADGAHSWDPARLSDPAEGFTLWQILAGQLLTKNGTLRKKKPPAWSSEWESFAEVAEALAGIPGLEEALGDVAAAGPCTYSDSQWRRLAALTTLLPVAAAELLLVFQAHRTWDFTEVGLRAVQLLGAAEAPTTMALRLDYQIRHLLIDEFQDTSVLQYRLLEGLTAGWAPGDGHTLFVVGDPMQSIYGFRKAEVGLFTRLRMQGVHNVPVAPLTLISNFRSQAAIVEWVNAAFARIMPAAAHADEGAVPYAASHPAREAGGHIGIHALADADLDQEAACVAELARVALAKDAEQSIAVLVRSRGHGHAVATALAKAGLPFAAVAMYSLAAREVVRDLLALTTVLVMPGARLELLACLRAPWCGLDLGDLAALAEGHTGSLWARMADAEALDGLSADGRARVGRFHAVMSEALAACAQLPLSRRVEQAWWALGGPAVVPAQDALEEAELFLRVLGGCERAGDVDLAILQAQVDALYAPADAGPGRVQILTIHKAKGLEYDTVILPGLARKGQPDKKPLLLAVERGGREPSLLFAPLKLAAEDHDALYDSLWALQQRKSRHEDARLMYVACTRARRNLHLVAHYKTKANGDIAVAERLKVLWPAIEEAFTAAARAGTPPTIPASAAAAAPVMRRLPAAWRADDLPPWPAAPRSDPSQPVFDWASVRIRIVGLLVHALLAEISLGPLPDPGDAMTAWEGMVRGQARRFGLTGEDLAFVLASVMEAVRKTLADPKGRQLIAPRPGARNEWALTAAQGEGDIRHVRVDRTFVDEAGVRWIVDYKTSRHEGAGLAEFLDEQQGRYRDQLEGYARFLAAFDPRPIELVLYFPLLQEWRRWTYDPVTP